MSVPLWKGWVTVPPVSGYCFVRRQGESTDRRVSITRDAAAAVAGDWLLVMEAGGVLWGIGLLGTAATPAPPDVDPPPDPAEPSQPSQMFVPAAWVGTWAWHNDGGAPGAPYDWVVRTTAAGYWGRSRWWIHEVVARFGGLTGLDLTAASLSITAAGNSSAVPTTALQVKLWSAPASPPNLVGSHPDGFTLLDTIPLGSVWPPPAGGIDVPLPSTWLAKLASGEATGLGLAETTTDIPADWAYIGWLGPLIITYN